MSTVSPMYPNGCISIGNPVNVRIPKEVKKIATGCKNRILKMWSIDFLAKSLLEIRHIQDSYNSTQDRHCVYYEIADHEEYEYRKVTDSHHSIQDDIIRTRSNRIKHVRHCELR